jgi:regulator of protease activity HflC (stomatin/prohibitin superfamily)
MLKYSLYVILGLVIFLLIPIILIFINFNLGSLLLGISLGLLGLLIFAVYSYAYITPTKSSASVVTFFGTPVAVIGEGLSLFPTWVPKQLAKVITFQSDIVDIEIPLTNKSFLTKKDTLGKAMEIDVNSVALQFRVTPLQDLFPQYNPQDVFQKIPKDIAQVYIDFLRAIDLGNVTDLVTEPVQTILRKLFREFTWEEILDNEDAIRQEANRRLQLEETIQNFPNYENVVTLKIGAITFPKNILDAITAEIVAQLQGKATIQTALAQAEQLKIEAEAKKIARILSGQGEATYTESIVQVLLTAGVTPEQIAQILNVNKMSASSGTNWVLNLGGNSAITPEIGQLLTRLETVLKKGGN